MAVMCLNRVTQCGLSSVDITGKLGEPKRKWQPCQRRMCWQRVARKERRPFSNSTSSRRHHQYGLIFTFSLLSKAERVACAKSVLRDSWMPGFSIGFSSVVYMDVSGVVLSDGQSFKCPKASS